MELVRPLTAVGRRWKPLAAGAVLAIALAIAVGRPAPTTSAVAWTRMTLDTPKSQLLEPSPRGAETLPWRASLLVHLMSTDEAVRELASRTGVRPDEVAVVDQALAEPLKPASMPSQAAEAASMTVAPYVLTLYVRNVQIPMISIEAAAPDRRGAERLAGAAAGMFEEKTSQVASRYRSEILTGGGAAMKRQTYVVEQVADVHSRSVVAMAPPTKLVGIALLLFAWCGGVLLGPPLLRLLRGSRAPVAA